MTPKLIVMLTHNDRTVINATKIFEESIDSSAEYWGFKEEGIPLEEMKELYKMMKDAGKTTFLEVVAYTEEECLEGAKMAKECDVDILMGTMFFDSINEFTKENNIKYMPFIGKIEGRPSVLYGTIEEMIEEGKKLKEKGVYGIDLLGYRYVGDPVELNKRIVEEVGLPICLAGSISSYERLDEVKAAMPWTFTIGSAFFDNKFEGSFGEQINKVVEYVNA